MAIIQAPSRTSPIVLAAVRGIERVLGRPLEVARLLAWYPRAAVGMGTMEAFVAHDEGRLSGRVLQIVRLSASLTANCAFCIDMNGADRQRTQLSDEQVRLLSQLAAGESSAASKSFTELEWLAARYASEISRTPLAIPTELLAEVAATFTPREVVILASTAAQVNMWARLIQGLGIAPAGFSDTCRVVTKD